MPFEDTEPLGGNEQAQTTGKRVLLTWLTSIRFQLEESRIAKLFLTNGLNLHFVLQVCVPCRGEVGVS